MPDQQQLSLCASCGYTGVSIQDAPVLILWTHTLVTYAPCRAAEHLYLLLLPKLRSETIFFSVTVKVKRICRF